jgi:hypothetical protein
MIPDTNPAPILHDIRTAILKRSGTRLTSGCGSDSGQERQGGGQESERGGDVGQPARPNG